MRTANSSLYGGGGLPLGGVYDRDPMDKDPQKEHGINDRDPPEGTWDRAARQEVTSYRDPMWTDRQTPVKILPCPKLRLQAVIIVISGLPSHKR